MTTHQAVDAHEHGIDAADGRTLAATTFRGAGDEVVVIAGATAVPRRVYAGLARAVASFGPTAIVFDYRGVGGSTIGHPRHEPARKRDWGMLDLEGVLRYAAALDPTRLLWIGQSAGGAYLPLAASCHLVDRMVTVSVMSGYWGRMAPAERFKLGFAWHTIFPLVTRVFGYAPGWMWAGEPLPPEVFREWGRWCRMPGYFFDDPTVDTSGFARFAAPILAVRATDDAWATEANHRGLHERFTSATVTYRDVTPQELGAERIGHIGLLRERVGGPLWPELLGQALQEREQLAGEATEPAHRQPSATSALYSSAAAVQNARSGRRPGRRQRRRSSPAPSPAPPPSPPAGRRDGRATPRIGRGRRGPAGRRRREGRRPSSRSP